MKRCSSCLGDTLYAIDTGAGSTILVCPQCDLRSDDAPDPTVGRCGCGNLRTGADTGPQCQQCMDEATAGA